MQDYILNVVRKVDLVDNSILEVDAFNACKEIIRYNCT